MEVLQSEILAEILNFLSASEIASLMPTCKAFYCYGVKDSIWNKHCKKLFPRSAKQGTYELFRNSVHSFLEIAETLDGILRFVNQKLTRHVLYKSVSIRASKKLEGYYKHPHRCEESTRYNLKHLKQRFLETAGSEMPQDLYYIYSLFDGQESYGMVPGLFGTYRFYNVLTNLVFLTLEKAFSLYHYPLFPIAACDFSHLHLLIDLENDLRKGKGAVFFSTGISGTYLYISPCISEYLKCYYRKLKYEVIEVGDVLINSFEKNENSSDLTTEGIRIEASSLFVPHLSTLGQYLFVYQIRISANSPTKRWQLKYRTWHIQDEDGNEQEVLKQPGVVGLYPQIYSGCDPTVYESCTRISSTSGKMSGYFTFQNLDDPSETKDAPVGEFKLRLPEGSELVSRAHLP